MVYVMDANKPIPQERHRKSHCRIHQAALYKKAYIPCFFLTQSNKLRKLKTLNIAAMKSLSVLCMCLLLLTGLLMPPSAEATRVLSEATPRTYILLSLYIYPSHCFKF